MQILIFVKFRMDDRFLRVALPLATRLSAHGVCAVLCAKMKK